MLIASFLIRGTSRLESKTTIFTVLIRFRENCRFRFENDNFNEIAASSRKFYFSNRKRSFLRIRREFEILSFSNRKRFRPRFENDNNSDIAREGTSLTKRLSSRTENERSSRTLGESRRIRLELVREYLC